MNGNNETKKGNMNNLSESSKNIKNKPKKSKNKSFNVKYFKNELNGTKNHLSLLNREAIHFQDNKSQKNAFFSVNLKFILFKNKKYFL